MECKKFELFNQLQQARRLNFIQGIDSLIFCEKPNSGAGKTLMPVASTMTLDPNAIKLYVRFDPRVSMGQILDIKRYVEEKYSFTCSVCEWSVPTRLDINLNINT